MRRFALGVLVAIALAMVILQSAPGIARFFTPVRTTAGDILAGTGQEGGSAQPGLFARLTGRAAQHREIRALEARVRELSRYEAAARSMAERLEAYEAMLNAIGEPPLKGVTARVTAESGGPFLETMLANAGQLHGVETGYVAVNEGGLVGRVIQLGERSCRILLVSDFNSRIPVMGEVSGVRAILSGDRRRNGVLADLPEEDRFVAGERILTSGEAGVFPRGQVVGTVLSSDDPAGPRRVAFAMHNARGGFVRLLPPAKIAPPEAEPARPEETVAEMGPAPSAEVTSQ